MLIQLLALYYTSVVLFITFELFLSSTNKIYFKSNFLIVNSVCSVLIAHKPKHDHKIYP